MLKCYFENGYFIIPLSCLPKEGHFGFGFCCDAVFGGEKREAYAMLNGRNAPEPSYVDICMRTGDDECIVTDHLPLEGIEFTDEGFDEEFVERYAYGADERAWLDDLCCVLDGELDNISHWQTVKECGLSEEDASTCGTIYERLLNGDTDKEFHEGMEYFNSGIVEKYGESIRKRISEYEDTLMKMAFDEFRSKIQFKTK